MKYLAAVNVAFCLILAGCGPIEYHTFYEGISDPAFDIGQANTVGLTAFYWTKAGQAHRIDELLEKQLLHFCKAELEKRGFRVEYIPRECMKEVGEAVHCEGMAKYPDLTLNVGYHVQQGIVNVPGKSYGSLSLGPYGGQGQYMSHTSYDVTVWTLSVHMVLWTGAPQYIQPVWRGMIVQGSPKPDLMDQAGTMVSNLFKTKFPRFKKQPGLSS